MTPKRLIFHVGHPKTGTTAVQKYLVHYSKQLEEMGVSFPFDLSMHPKGPAGNSIGVPQMDGSHHFFKTGRNWIKQTSIDWNKELERLQSAEGPTTFLISDETLFNSATRIRKEVFRRLGQKILVIFVVYLRHPIDMLNSRLLQVITSGRDEFSSFIQSLPSGAHRYVQNGYSQSIAKLSEFGTVRVQSYEAATKTGLVKHFCHSIDIPFLGTGYEEFANTKSFGYKTGLVFMGFRKTQGVFNRNRKEETQPKLFQIGEKIDVSPKHFLSQNVFDDVMARWDQERGRIEDKFGINLQSRTEQEPAKAHLRIDRSFGAMFLDNAESKLTADERQQLEKAIEVAELGFDIFKNYGTRIKRE